MQIDHNITAPADVGRGRRRKYPFPDMEVGDSIRVENGRSKSAYMALRQWIRRTGQTGEYRMHKMPDEGCFRIFRIK